jgi:HicA toxin of bacterial toxin-antitoxin,
MVGQTSHRQYRHRTKKGRVTIAGKPSDDVHPGTEKSILGRLACDRGELMSDPLWYLVVFEHSAGTGYSAWVPDLPGCIAAAETREGCERLLACAVASCQLNLLPRALRRRRACTARSPVAVVAVWQLREITLFR